MRKILAAAIATTLIAAASVAVTAAPANAGGIYVGIGGWGSGWGPGYGYYGYHHPRVVAVPVYEDDYDDYDTGGLPEAHVDWCDDHYQTYDEDTNLYFYKPGKQRQCVSPYWPG